jgi:hypothetical protein
LFFSTVLATCFICSQRQRRWEAPKKRQKAWFVLLAIAFPFLYFKCYEIF